MRRGFRVFEEERIGVRPDQFPIFKQRKQLLTDMRSTDNSDTRL